MYLHLGRETLVMTGDLIAILDIDKATIKKDSREFLKKATNRGDVINVTDELPKSFIITDEKVYISQLSPTTLKKRSISFKG